MKSKFNKLFTSDSENINEIPWNIYPRPLLKRDSFFCLNGEWDFEISGSADIPDYYSKKILVPYAPQSLLSGLNINISDSSYLFYKREFTLPTGFVKQRVIINFGASDCYTTVFINGCIVCNHKGGYDSFSADITEHLKENNTIIVRVFDDLSNHIMPYGKQTQKRGGMWYTPVSGIWQTVWLESVNENYIKDIKTYVNDTQVKICVDKANTNGNVIINCGESELNAKLIDGVCTFEIDNPKYWDTENPFLYYFTIHTQTDTVSSYFAIRNLEIKTVNNIKRLCVNNKPVFFNGILDQGYFSDGIFTPATFETFTNEILNLKKLGFNMLRKHIKIEPQLFYYECDRLGMFVFQDMVNNGKYSFLRDTALPTLFSKRKNDKHLHKDAETRNEFKASMIKTVNGLYNHPSIVLWTIFNEGWGQFNSSEMYTVLKELDSTRFIDTASGWFKGGKSDVESDHVYFKPYKFKTSDKPVILSEFGGYTYSDKDHIFNPNKSYGYKTLKSIEELNSAISKLYKRDVIPYVQKGLCASVYTQVSDVEDEINGIFTYDRKVQKVSTEVLLNIAEKLKI